MKKKNKGRIVQLPDGRKGRTFNHLPLIKGKVQVYIIREETVVRKMAPGATPLKPMRMLVSPSKLKLIGHID